MIVTKDGVKPLKLELKSFKLLHGGFSREKTREMLREKKYNELGLDP